MRVARIIESQLGLDQDVPAQPIHLAVVVSAMGGQPKVTDLLLQTVEYASERHATQVDAALELIVNKHDSTLRKLFPQHTSSGPSERDRLMNLIHNDIENIRDILKTVALMKWRAERISELISGYGELWSTQILTALLTQRSRERYQGLLSNHHHHHGANGVRQHKFVYLDARRVITIDEEAIQHGAIVWELSEQKLDQVYQEEMLQWEASSSNADNADNSAEDIVVHFVITGYVATNTNGVATTLQRDGSDYSAAIMGRLLRANKITIWTDVDGVLSADPRRVPNALVLPEVSYNEAMELAYFGAKVIHPKTMQPAISCRPQIPIYIRNTFRPSYPGTCIFLSATSTKDADKVVCGFSSVEGTALVNVEGSGMIGVPGVAKRLFGTLERVGVNVILISQASSEHSISFATTETHAIIAKEAIEEEFARELHQNRISHVDVVAPCSIIAAVGDGMHMCTGVSGRFFSALGDAKINVLAIAQGSSERNISAVVWSCDSSRALRAVHSAFNLSYTTIRVGIVGMSEIGESLLKLLETQRNALRSIFDIDVQVCAVVPGASSTEMLSLQRDTDIGTDSITFRAYSKIIKADNENASRATFSDEHKVAALTPGGVATVLDRLYRFDCTSHALFDCTNDENVAKHHAEWLRAGVDVVTANNTGLSGDKSQRSEIKAAETALGKQSAKYLREVTVAGGLPVISTLRSLLNSGDKIARIDGIFTVALSYIMFRISPPLHMDACSKFDQEFSHGAFRGDLSISPDSSVNTPCSFSQAVKEAIALGLTEDDPTTDLNNEYAARMLMVLARELGMDDANETSAIQAASDTLIDVKKVSNFRDIPASIDQEVQKRVDAARARGCVLRHVASIDVREKLIEMKLVEVPEHHVFAVSPPSCACVRFFTQRHRSYPLIIQGPSAGADSTASALLAELLQRSRGKSNPRSLALNRDGSGAQLLHASKANLQNLV